MQFLSSSVLALAMIGGLAALGPRRGLWLFFAMMPLGAAAAFNMPSVGNASVGIKELGVIVVFAMVFARAGGPASVFGSLRPGQPGFVALALYVYCVISALWVPSILNGVTEVFAISRSANAHGIRSIPLGPTAGNITQLFAMTLSLMAFVALATLARRHPDPRRIETALAVATALNLALGLLDIASAALGRPEIMEPLRTANYSILSEARMLGLKRMIGGFPEASSFGSFSMGLFGFWLHRWLHGPAAGRRRALLMLLIALFCVLRATSSAAYVGLVLFLAVYALFGAGAQLRRVFTRRVARVAIAGGLLAWLTGLVLFAAYRLVGPVTAYLDQALFSKLGSESGIERMSWNAQALRNFMDTWMIGAGLGSARASNWLLSSLGSVGLPGTALFVLFLAGVFRMRAGTPASGADIAAGALKWGCAATLACEMLIASTPNIGVFFFALAGLATGLARGSQMQRAAGGWHPEAGGDAADTGGGYPPAPALPA